MARTIAIVNQKGGVGKTTTAVNLSTLLAYSGRRVLVVDADAQGNATLDFGYDPDELDEKHATLALKGCSGRYMCRTSPHQTR